RDKLVTGVQTCALPICLGRQVRGEGLGWHQDGVFYGGVSGSVGIWLAITSAGKDAPALSVLPRRFDDLIGVAPGERLPLSLEYRSEERRVGKEGGTGWG